MSSGKGRSEPFLSPNTKGERTKIRPGQVKRLSLKNCSGLLSTSSMRSPKRLDCSVRPQARQHSWFQSGVTTIQWRFCWNMFILTLDSFFLLEILPFRDSPFQRSPFQRFPILEIPPFRDSLFQRFPVPRPPFPHSRFSILELAKIYSCLFIPNCTRLNKWPAY